MTPRSICLHGPESTGKSTLGPLMARRLGGRYVPEYGRIYCETHGTDLSMPDLLTIAQRQDALAREAIRHGPWPVVLDTDPLMTAVWADMLFGRREPWFDAWQGIADLYLLFDIDLPWVADGTRLFGNLAERSRFAELSRRELERRRVCWRVIRGARRERCRSLMTALRTSGLLTGSSD